VPDFGLKRLDSYFVSIHGRKERTWIVSSLILPNTELVVGWSRMRE
jgi:hypothetical protein